MLLSGLPYKSATLVSISTDGGVHDQTIAIFIATLRYGMRNSMERHTSANITLLMAISKCSPVFLLHWVTMHSSRTTQQEVCRATNVMRIRGSRQCHTLQSLVHEDSTVYWYTQGTHPYIQCMVALQVYKTNTKVCPEDCII